MRDLFQLIQQTRDDWAFTDGDAESPCPINLKGEVHGDSDYYEDDEQEKRVKEDPPKPKHKMERKNANASLERSRSDLSEATLSPPNALLKGMGFNVHMTPEQEAELHEILMAINQLDPDPDNKSYPERSMCFIKITYASILVGQHF